MLLPHAIRLFLLKPESQGVRRGWIGIVLGGMAGIDLFRRLPFALRRHLRWVGSTGDTARPELFALQFFFGFRGLNAVWRR
jgi:hypothetical protein